MLGQYNLAKNVLVSFFLAVALSFLLIISFLSWSGLKIPKKAARNYFKIKINSTYEQAIYSFGPHVLRVHPTVDSWRYNLEKDFSTSSEEEKESEGEEDDDDDKEDNKIQKQCNQQYRE